jgi:hypothetical protein
MWCAQACRKDSRLHIGLNLFAARVTAHVATIPSHFFATCLLFRREGFVREHTPQCRRKRPHEEHEETQYVTRFRHHVDGNKANI